MIRENNIKNVLRENALWMCSRTLMLTRTMWRHRLLNLPRLLPRLLLQCLSLLGLVSSRRVSWMIRVNNEQRKTHSAVLCLSEPRWVVNCCFLWNRLWQGGQKYTPVKEMPVHTLGTDVLVESLLSRWNIDDAMTQTWLSDPLFDRTRRCSPIARRGRTASCLNGLRITAWWNRFGKCIV